MSFSFQRFLFLEADYEEASVFAEERRARSPALYNERRLFERPLPDLLQAYQIEAENHIASNFTNQFKLCIH